MKLAVELDIASGDCVSACKEVGATVCVHEIKACDHSLKNPSVLNELKKKILSLGQNGIEVVFSASDYDLVCDSRKEPHHLANVRSALCAAKYCGIRTFILAADNNITDDIGYKSLYANISRVMRDVPLFLHIKASGSTDPSLLFRHMQPIIEFKSAGIMVDAAVKSNVPIIGSCSAVCIPYSFNPSKLAKEDLHELCTSLSYYNGCLIFSGKHKNPVSRALKLKELVV